MGSSTYHYKMNFILNMFGNHHKAINYSTACSFHPLIQSKGDIIQKYFLCCSEPHFWPQSVFYKPHAQQSQVKHGQGSVNSKLPSVPKKYLDFCKLSIRVVMPLMSLLKSTPNVTKICILNFGGGTVEKGSCILLSCQDPSVSVVCSNTAIYLVL